MDIVDKNIDGGKAFTEVIAELKLKK